LRLGTQAKTLHPYDVDARTSSTLISMECLTPELEACVIPSPAPSPLPLSRTPEFFDLSTPPPQQTLPLPLISEPPPVSSLVTPTFRPHAPGLYHPFPRPSQPPQYPVGNPSSSSSSNELHRPHPSFHQEEEELTNYDEEFCPDCFMHELDCVCCEDFCNEDPDDYE